MYKKCIFFLSCINNIQSNYKETEVSTRSTNMRCHDLYVINNAIIEGNLELTDGKIFIKGDLTCQTIESSEISTHNIHLNKTPVVGSGTPLNIDENGNIKRYSSSQLYVDDIQAINDNDSQDLYNIIPRSFVINQIRKFGIIPEDLITSQILPHVIEYINNNPDSVDYNSILTLLLYEFFKLKTSYDANINILQQQRLSEDLSVSQPNNIFTISDLIKILENASLEELRQIKKLINRKQK